jgi:hypothetical protein
VSLASRCAASFVVHSSDRNVSIQAENKLETHFLIHKIRAEFMNFIFTPCARKALTAHSSSPLCADLLRRFSPSPNASAARDWSLVEVISLALRRAATQSVSLPHVLQPTHRHAVEGRAHIAGLLPKKIFRDRNQGAPAHDAGRMSYDTKRAFVHERCTPREARTMNARHRADAGGANAKCERAGEIDRVMSIVA